MSEGSSYQISPSASEAPSTSKATESIASKEDTQPVKTKKDEKQTMDEKIAAQKAKKNIKEEEPVFAGMKLKKSKQLQRQWTEPELETVKLKDHQFEQIAQIETVILIHFCNMFFSRCLDMEIDYFSLYTLRNKSKHYILGRAKLQRYSNKKRKEASCAENTETS